MWLSNTHPAAFPHQKVQLRQFVRFHRVPHLPVYYRIPKYYGLDVCRVNDGHQSLVHVDHDLPRSVPDQVLARSREAIPLSAGTATLAQFQVLGRWVASYSLDSDHVVPTGLHVHCSNGCRRAQCAQRGDDLAAIEWLRDVIHVDRDHQRS